MFRYLPVGLTVAAFAALLPTLGPIQADPHLAEVAPASGALARARAKTLLPDAPLALTGSTGCAHEPRNY